MAPARLVRTRRNSTRLAPVARVVAALCFLVAGVSASWPVAEAGAPTQPVRVEVIDNAFAPATISVPPGGTVVFHNAGLSVHEVVADDSTFDSGPLEPGQTWTLTVGSEEVTIAIHCAIHSEMRGEIDVTRAPFEPSVGTASATTTGSTATTPRTTTAGASSTAPPELAMTGRGSRPLTLVAVLCLLLGASVLAMARPKPVPLLASIPRDGDDILPARDGARRG